MKIKPLTIIGNRKLPNIPEYFQVHTIYYSDITSTKNRFLVTTSKREIISWIETNLDKRYAVVTHTMGNNAVIRIGFEDPSDLLMFQLGYPNL